MDSRTSTIFEGHRLTFVMSFTTFTLLSLFSWQNLFQSGFTSSIVTQSGDPGLLIWMIAWFPHAIEHGLNPFYSNYIYSSTGINLMDNISVFTLGALFSPITILFGPIVSYNLAVIMAPIASGLSMVFFLTKLSKNRLACFLGGLIFAYSPIATAELKFGHFQTAFSAFIPLISAQCYDIVITNSQKWIKNGLSLAALIALEFFISLEALSVFILLSIIFIAPNLKRLLSSPVIIKTFLLSLLVDTVILIYPSWFFFFGKSHFNGSIWNHIGRLSATLKSLLVPHGQDNIINYIARANVEYIGVVLITFIAIFSIKFFKHSTFRYITIFTITAILLTLGSHLTISTFSIPFLYKLIGQIPGLQDIMPIRIATATYFGIGTFIALVVNKYYTAFLNAKNMRTSIYERRFKNYLLVSIFALISVLSVLIYNPWPNQVSSISIPRLLHEPYTPLNSTIVEYPPATGSNSKSMIYQSELGFKYRLFDGYGVISDVNGKPTESPRDSSFYFLIIATSLGRLSSLLTNSQSQLLHSSLKESKITEVFVLGDSNTKFLVADLDLTLGKPRYTYENEYLWYVN